MRNTTTGIVETAAIAIGLAVKKGAAANGIVLSGAGDKSLGISDDTDFNASNVVGEQATIAVDGIVQAVAGAAVTAGDSLEADAAAKLILIAGVGTHERVAVALESGIADELIKVKVIIDEVIL